MQYHCLAVEAQTKDVYEEDEHIIKIFFHPSCFSQKKIAVGWGWGVEVGAALDGH